MPSKNNESIISDPLRSDKIKALITQKPSFIERNASLLFVLILVLVIAIFSFIRYPTVLTEHGILRTLNDERLDNNPANPQSINCVVTYQVSKNNTKCIKAGQEIKLRFNGILPEQFILVQCHIDSTSKESLNGNCLLFSTLLQKEVNNIKLETNGADSLETEIFFVIDNPTILQRLIHKFL